MEMDTDIAACAGAPLDTNDDDQVVYLPLVDYEGKLLPVPFLTGSEVRTKMDKQLHVRKYTNWQISPTDIINGDPKLKSKLKMTGYVWQVLCANYGMKVVPKQE